MDVDPGVVGPVGVGPFGSDAEGGEGAVKGVRRIPARDVRWRCCGGEKEGVSRDFFVQCKT